MHKKKLSVKMINRISIVVTVVVILTGVYIMANQLGLVDSLDFGAGAYYYADMPGFEKLVNGNHYQSPVSMGTLTVLFLIWGWIMYRAWIWLDKQL